MIVSGSMRSLMAPRACSPINRGWRYVAEPLDDADGVEGVEICLPHPNVVLPAQGFDDRDYQFVSTYRRRLRLDPGLVGQRVQVRFDGVMTAANVYCNGELVGAHVGGFIPFSCELTTLLRFDGEDELVVEVDSTERPDLPPFGGFIDFLTFGGIYRGVTLSVLPQIHIVDVFVRGRDVLTGRRRLEIDYRLHVPATAERSGLHVEAAVLDGETVVARATGPVEEVDHAALEHASGSDVLGAPSGSPASGRLAVTGLAQLKLWDVDAPNLFHVAIRLYRGDELIDEVTVRTGLRQAEFTAQGFFLNGRRIGLRGLNRHQTYPHVGGAMPDRMQRRDAEILREEFKCNAVRTSHYPQAPSFLDACDELGLLVFEEMPGWQHIGDQAWQDVACHDVATMIVRDRNHPSIVLWGVRVNESADCEQFYRRTNDLAHRLDDSRPTSGVRYLRESQLLEDVFALNDFQTGGVIDRPNHPRYVVSEYAGHMFPTKRYDNVQRVEEHAILHANVLNAIAGERGIAGGFGWCAFDYATHAEFGSGNRICYHGVADMFRVPKHAASVYRSQCDPAEAIVLEPAFLWAGGDASDYGGPGRGMILSNCTRVRAYVADELVADLQPDDANYPNLAHPPFFFTAESGIAPWRRTWGDLRLDGYIGEELATSRTLSGRGVDRQFSLSADHAELQADGADTTRLVLRVTDEHGNDRPFTVGAVQLHVSGPAELVGDNPIALTGGVAALWLRATERPGEVVVTATHPTLGCRTVRITVAEVAGEAW